MAALTSRRPLPASYSEAHARGGEVSLVESQRCQECRSWHKALLQSSGSAARCLPLVSNALLSALSLFFPPCQSRLPDGLTRRGDINLLMLGDPGTAKSQLLKFVEKCSPIGVGGFRCLLTVWLISFLCSLRSTKDQAGLGRCLPLRPSQLYWLREVQTAISSGSLEEMGCRTETKGEKEKQIKPFVTV